ncbi:MAG: RNA polymerase sigma factor SigZ [Sneathiella sp.]|nr:RNA polymerase sigma factor SigZ [Sneathiella sp.]
MDSWQVWLEYKGNLKSFLHSRVSNPADVDDLLQEIFIKTYDNIHTLRSTENVKSWLFQITNNAIMDHYRQSKKSAEINPDDLWYGQEEPDQHQKMSACIAPFINALPKSSAQMLRKIDLEGMSQKQYAEINNIGYSTVKSRVQKSRLDLRNLFENCCKISFGKNNEVVNCDVKSNGCGDC